MVSGVRWKFFCGLWCGMMVLIHGLLSVKRQVRVDLRCRNIRVTKDGLNCAQVGAVLNHMRGAGMPQHVWRSRPPGAGRSSTNHLPNALASELASTAGDEQQR